MTRATAIAALLAALAAVPAAAFQCPTDMAAIDAALATATLSDAERAKVMELRARGEELHAAGEHQASVDTLTEAKAILGL